MSIRQMPELLGQTEAVLHVFGRYKIFCHFNAAVQIMDLKIRIRWLIYKDNEPYKTKQNPNTQKKQQQKPNPPIFRLCYIYSSKPETDRVVSNSKKRTKYMTSNQFPVLSFILVFPKASSLNLWIWFPWLKFHYTEMLFIHSSQLFFPL